MQRNTKQFDYHLQKSQLKRSLFISEVSLSLATFLSFQIWCSFLTKNHLSSKERQCLTVKHCLSFILEFSCLNFFWRKSITFQLGKQYLNGCNCKSFYLKFVKSSDCKAQIENWILNGVYSLGLWELNFLPMPSLHKCIYWN